jgi:myo-inositol-hexaphosphate 3-phosphohydrolase
VGVFALPGRAFVREFIAGALDLRDEPNLALLHRPDGATWAYVSADTVAYIRDAASGAALGQFTPDAGLETLAADDRAQVVYIPDENGRTGVYAYDPLGAPHRRGGTHRFGSGVFDSDAEGIAIYRCLGADGADGGAGWIVVADQRADHSEFEFFDRRSWRHLGALELTGVANTDGIGSTQRALPGHPQGVFAAIDDDTRAVGVGWHRILAATGLACPLAPGPPALAPH